MSANLVTTEPRRPIPTNFVAQTISGFFYPLRAFGFITRNRLWPLTIVAIAINALLLILLIVATFYFAVPLLDAADRSIMSWSDSEWLEPGLVALAWLMWIVTVPVLVALDAIALVMLGQAVASPFLDMLSEKVEAIMLGTTAPDFTVARALESVLFGITDLIASLVFLVVINLPLFLLGLIPVISPFAAAASFWFSALLLAQEFATMPAGRAMVSFRKRFGIVWRNKWLSFGFGVATMGIMLVPGLNLLLLPLAAAGGTMAYCDLHGAGLAKPQ